jgi:hypothetical protein
VVNPIPTISHAYSADITNIAIFSDRTVRDFNINITAAFKATSPDAAQIIVQYRIRLMREMLQFVHFPLT